MRAGLRLYNCRCNMQPNRIPVTEVARMKTYIKTVLLSAMGVSVLLLAFAACGGDAAPSNATVEVTSRREIPTHR